MDQFRLKKQIDEDTVVRTLFDVHRIRRISQDQINDILSVQPNHLPPIVERANEFLAKLAHLAMMYKLQEECEDKQYTKDHPDEAQAVEEYFQKDELQNDKVGDEIVALGCIYYSIGKFCMSTDKFFKEIAGTPGNSRSELIRNILKDLDAQLEEHAQDSPAVNRYAYRFFKKLIEKNGRVLPKGVTVDDMKRYMKMYVYDDELDR